MKKIYIMNNHKQMAKIISSKKDIILLHIDAHCDLREAVIDIKKGKIYICVKNQFIDNGNFLLALIKNRNIKKIYWLYDKYSGRRNDTFSFKLINEVKRKRLLKCSEYDFILKKLNNKLLNTEINTINYISLDWDYIANPEKSKEEIEKDIKFIFQILKNSNFKEIYISFSSCYTGFSYYEFLNFIENIKKEISNDIYYLENIKRPLILSKKYYLLKERVKKKILCR